jgi:hypothetical protein
VLAMCFLLLPFMERRQIIDVFTISMCIVMFRDLTEVQPLLFSQ